MSARAVHTLRLACGLILLTYLSTHLSNHALGLVSLAAMEEGLRWFLVLWRNPLATVALYGALLTHAVLALWALYRKRTLRMPAWEATQLVLGLMIPPILVVHVVGNRLAHELFGIKTTYARVLASYWIVSPWRGAVQTALVLIAWTHGCMGIHFWLRFRPWYPRAARPLAAVAAAIPLLGLAGFVLAGVEVTELARAPGWTRSVFRTDTTVARAVLGRTADEILGAWAMLLVITLLARGARGAYRRRFDSITLTYPGGRTVRMPTGATVLEASRSAGIPHVSVCGGRGRCSTCRIRVSRGLDAQPAASEAERRVLQRVGAEPDVRLACQLRPTEDLAVVPMLAAVGDAAQAATHEQQGVEREIVVLFADLRGFTRMAERRLPYDVVFFLNRYFAAAGSAIEMAGGVANQFTGDGVMALFGVEVGPEAGCRQALAAARGIVAGVEALSRELAGELALPLRIGIGIHVGPAVVGRMGYRDNTYFTAVGDTVHVAARFEQATKDFGCDLVVSDEVMRRAGLDASTFPRHELPLRNRAEPVAVRVIERVVSLGDA